MLHDGIRIIHFENGVWQVADEEWGGNENGKKKMAAVMIV